MDEKMSHRFLYGFGPLLVEVDIPDMPQQVGYMPQGNIHGLGISPHTVSAAHIAAPGDLDAEIFDIEFLHVRRFEIVA